MAIELMRFLFELHADMPRQGPGDDVSTCQALALLPGLPPAPQILDIGCGPGMQSLALARASGGAVTALDFHLPYLEQLAASAQAQGLAGQIQPVQADMTALPFAPHSFDLVWSEGAIYSMGFAAGLRAWRSVLRPGGCLAVTEISWLRPDPPAELADFWQRGYPAMGSIEQNLALMVECGYSPLAPFSLPPQSWWQHYYDPLQQRVDLLRRRYAADPEALALLAETQLEMDLYRRYADWYGYVFYLARLD